MGGGAWQRLGLSSAGAALSSALGVSFAGIADDLHHHHHLHAPFLLHNPPASITLAPFHHSPLTLQAAPLIAFSHLSQIKPPSLSFEAVAAHRTLALVASPSPLSYLSSFYSSIASSPHAKTFRSLIAAHQRSPLSRYFHSWHYPCEEEGPACGRKQVMAVVLLGWLGAKQKHLRRYANWYTTRGIHAVTFVLPMGDLLGLKPGEKAEQRIDVLSNHLALWLSEEAIDGSERVLMFHTFSNTGWLTYGVVLEKLLQHDNKLVNKIKGCVVDSAPVLDLDPHVWASGFSAAFLKKRSIATQGTKKESKENQVHQASTIEEPRPNATETALLTMLEKFFSFLLEVPPVKRRLSEVVSILSKKQPPCPQLYLYSSADRVIPAAAVESFIAQQRQAGRRVRACNLQWSPHVDHFRSYPDVYSSQLASFLKECNPQCAG